jgi:phosphoribosylformylglycinamidine cyclo-ligase
VGVVERSGVIDGSRVRAGDVIIGLASSGVHSNGYSLVRKLIEVAGATDKTVVEGKLLFDRLLEPTRIYVKSMLALAAAVPVSGFAHITGGGLTDNIPRVLPDGLEAALHRSQWHRDPVFEWLAATGRIAAPEMHRTFNCGIGMVAIVPAQHAQRSLQLLGTLGESATIIGEIRAGTSGVVIIE